MNENQTLTFTLTVDQANLVLQALGEVAFKVSAPLVQELQKQAAAQMQPVEEAPAAE